MHRDSKQTIFLAVGCVALAGLVVLLAVGFLAVDRYFQGDDGSDTHDALQAGSGDAGDGESEAIETASTPAEGGSETGEVRTVQIGDQTIVGDVQVLDPDEVYASGDLAKAWAIAVDHGDVERVKLLLQDGVEPDSPLRPGRTALIASAWLGHTDLVRVLLAAGADPAAREEDTIGREGFLGDMAIHRAAYQGHLDIVKLLLEAGVPIDSEAGPDILRSTALTSSLGDYETFHFLLQHGASLEAAGGPSRLLKRAASRRNVETARFLLEAGASVEGEASDIEYGYTPLWSVVSGFGERGRVEMVRLLLENGANPETKMYDGKTLLELAREKGQTETVDLMEAALAGEL